jgi:hypothetical protein
MTWLVGATVVSTAVSFGLRTSALFLDERVNKWLRLVVAMIAGGLICGVILEVSDSYRIFDFGVGFLMAFSIMGPYDLARWWFRSRRRT